MDPVPIIGTLWVTVAMLSGAGHCRANVVIFLPTGGHCGRGSHRGRTCLDTRLQPEDEGHSRGHRQGVAFLPLAVESYGGWHEMGAREVERLGAALARQSGQEEDEAVRHLWGKLGILLQRGNAAILANRVPSFPVPAIDGQH